MTTSKEYNIKIGRFEIRQVIIYSSGRVDKYNEVSICGAFIPSSSEEYSEAMIALHNWKVESGISD